jgi:hypothetical protein
MPPTATLVLGTVLPLLAVHPSLTAASGFKEHHLQTLHGDQPGASFGAAIANAGDVNGDGWPDLVVGAPNHNGAAGERCGKALLFLGSPTGFATTPSWSAEGVLAGAQFGRVVASAGDVNNDGFDDVAIGSPGYAPPYYWYIIPGLLYVYLGSASGLAPDPVMVAEGAYDDRPYDGLGGALATGDFNGDGYADVAAAQFSRYVGRCAAFYGSASGPSSERVFIVRGHTDNHWGNSVAAADVNGDGFDDLVCTKVWLAHRVDFDGTGAVIHLGSPEGLSPTPAFVFENWFQAGAVGDVDRDGFDDLLVARSATPFTPATDHVLYRGSASGPLPGEPGPTHMRFETNWLRHRFSALGDINGDGFADAIADDEIASYVYLGTASGFRALSDGMGPPAVFAGAGDVNRDGFSDLARGDREHDRVDVYSGGTDWKFTAIADVAVDIYEMDGSVQFRVTNRGPDLVRFRVSNPFPPSAGRIEWRCYGEGLALCLPYGNYGPAYTGDVSALLSGWAAFEFGLPAGLLPIVNTASVLLPEWVVDPDLSNNQATVSVGRPRDPIFSDGFESGSVAAWSASSGDGLVVTRRAALDGAFGVEVTPSRSEAAVLRDETPADEVSYHARFRFDARELARSGPPFTATILAARNAMAAVLFDIRLEHRGRALFLIASTHVDDGTVRELPAARIDDVPHVVDVGWRRATAPGADDGLFMVRLDGRDVGALAAMDNDTLSGVDSVELGLTLRAFTPPLPRRRALFLDSFASWRVR